MSASLPRWLCLAVLLVTACVCVCADVAGSTAGLHVFRTFAPLDDERFSVVGTPNQADEFEFRIVFKIRGTDKLKKVADLTATPGSIKYQQFMRANDVSRVFDIRLDDAKPVINWVEASGARVDFQGSFMNVMLTVRMYERHFKAKLVLVHDKELDRVMLKTFDDVAIPKTLAHSVAVILGPSQWYRHSRLGRRASRKAFPPSQKIVLPLTLRALYGIPDNLTVTHPQSTVGVVEFTDDSFSDSDMKAFCHGVGVQIPPAITHKGPFNPQNPDGECTLDIQYITAVAPNATAWFWTVDSWVLEWAQDVAQQQHPPLVNSISWASPERDNPDYNARCDQEFMKLGLRGVSVLASSGDSGAVGTGSCSGNQHTFNPGYPGASPYATSVGATMLVDRSGAAHQVQSLPPVCTSGSYTCATGGFEQPANLPDGSQGDGFSTGGGVSVLAKQPEYQSAAVASYMNNASIPKPPSSAFNAQNRFFPDVAANGNNIVIYQSGPQLTGGTSASAPIVAGILALVNDHLISRNKNPLGFANPFLYKMAAEFPAAFQSIGDLNTNNKDGCPDGYVSNAAGYDPVTGLGTLNLNAILQYVDANLHMFKRLSLK